MTTVGVFLELLCLAVRQTSATVRGLRPMRANPRLSGSQFVPEPLSIAWLAALTAAATVVLRRRRA